MMTTVKILSLDDHGEWGKMLASMPIVQQDVYFSAKYYALHEKNGDGLARCFVYEETDDLLTPAEAGKEASVRRVMYPFLMNSVNDLGYEMGGVNSVIFREPTATMASLPHAAMPTLSAASTRTLTTTAKRLAS